MKSLTGLESTPFESCWMATGSGLFLAASKQGRVSSNRPLSWRGGPEDFLGRLDALSKHPNGRVIKAGHAHNKLQN